MTGILWLREETTFRGCMWWDINFPPSFLFPRPPRSVNIVPSPFLLCKPPAERENSPCEKEEEEEGWVRSWESLYRRRLRQQRLCINDAVSVFSSSLHVQVFCFVFVIVGSVSCSVRWCLNLSKKLRGMIFQNSILAGTRIFPKKGTRKTIHLCFCV